MADDLLEEAWWENADDLQEKSKKSKKRKVSSEAVEDVDAKGSEENLKKKKKKKNIHKNSKNGKSTECSIDSTTLWKYFSCEMKGKLSGIELEELVIDDSQYLAFKNPPVSLSDLSASLKSAIPNWEKSLTCLKETDKGCPLLLIITGSAKRCVDLIREIKAFKTPDCKTAKLFAKHFKLEDQQSFLSKTVVPICAGTPNRILKLATNGYLQLKKLKYVLIDWSFKDAKQRKIVDMQEVKSDLNQLLQLEILPRISKKELQFTLF